MNTFLHNETWISGAVLYGHAFQADTPKVRTMTDKLLEIATDRIVRNLTGYRFIMGDFNQLDGMLPQTQLWESLGWKEVQVLYEECHGVPIRHTCKMTTTKDFIWISPELQPFLESVDIVNHIFPDHGAVCAHFSSFGKAEVVHKRRKPKPIPWDEIKQPLPEGNFVFDFAQTPEQMCQAFAEEFESRVGQSLKVNGRGSLLSCQTGRCRTLRPKKLQAHSKPLKAGRDGEVVPEYQGHSLQHQRWFTQLRRIASLVRLLKHTPLQSNQFVHACREWRAIVNAPGFSHGFAVWWKSIEDRPFECPTELPVDLPSLTELLYVQLLTDREVRKFERTLQKSLGEKAKRARVQDPQKIFRDAAKPTTNPVQILDHSKHAQVIAVDPEDSSLILDSAPGFSDGPMSSIHGTFTPIAV